MFSIDLKDAFLQIPNIGIFNLLFGLLFRVFALVSEWAHQRGIRLLRYLDDWLVIVQSVPLLQHCEQLLQLCRDLGIVISWEKSDPKPSGMAKYLRMLIDTI